MKYLYIPLLFSIIVFFGCKKNEPKKLFSFMNIYGSNSTVVLYATPGDYFNGTNPVKSIAVVGKGIDMDVDELGEGKEYYADVYAPDYSGTNWANGCTTYTIKDPKYGVYCKISTGGSFYTEGAAGEGIGNIRGTLLKDKKQQNWKAIDAYKFSPYSTKRIWDSLSQNEKDVRLTITRSQIDFSSVLDGVRHNNSYSISSLMAMLKMRYKYSYMELAGFQGFMPVEIYNVAVPVLGELSNEYIPEKTPLSNDTISVYLQGYMSYIMVRQ